MDWVDKKKFEDFKKGFGSKKRKDDSPIEKEKKVVKKKGKRKWKLIESLKNNGLKSVFNGDA